MLDKDEMKKFGLDKEELDYSEPAVRNSFWQILDIASVECGFSTKGEKVLIQFYPSKTGGEIFITKLGSLSKSAERSISSSSKVAMLSSETKIFRFDDLNSIVSAVHVNFSNLTDSVKAYLAENGYYYLVLEERNNSKLGVMSEFASEVPKELEAYIRERSKIIDNPKQTFEALYAMQRGE